MTDLFSARQNFKNNRLSVIGNGVYRCADKR